MNTTLTEQMATLARVIERLDGGFADEQEIAALRDIMAHLQDVKAQRDHDGDPEDDMPHWEGREKWEQS